MKIHAPLSLMLIQKKTKKFAQGHEVSIKLSSVACKGWFHCFKDCAGLPDATENSNAAHGNAEAAKGFMKGRATLLTRVPAFLTSVRFM